MVLSGTPASAASLRVLSFRASRRLRRYWPRALAWSGSITCAPVTALIVQDSLRERSISLPIPQHASSASDRGIEDVDALLVLHGADVAAQLQVAGIGRNVETYVGLQPLWNALQFRSGTHVIQQ